MDAEKGYLQGRFDAVPFIDTSFSSLRKLLFNTNYSLSTDKYEEKI
jgi:hypothetical protein